jgi:uncharacterized protein YkwD
MKKFHAPCGFLETEKLLKPYFNRHRNHFELLMKTGFIIIIFLNCFLLKAQEKYPYSKWTPQELSWAKSGNSNKFMDSIETEVLMYCNLVRVNPKLFCETYLKEYIDVNQLNLKNYYVSSLISTLSNAKPIGILKPDIDFYEMAKYHAINMGILGKVGHTDFSKRAKKFLKGKDGYIGENCSYGEDNALDIFMSLLIDDGISDLGHRENLLLKNFNVVGISFQPHKTYGVNCVMDFGCDFIRVKEKTFFQKLIYWRD